MPPELEKESEPFSSPVRRPAALGALWLPNQSVMSYNKPMAKATIELDERIASALRAQAEARQMPLAAFLEQIASANLPPVTASPITEGEWNRMFDEVSSDTVPSSSSFPRSEIYGDHD
jgi:hypothetical protein